jgi:hypothetical protein
MISILILCGRLFINRLCSVIGRFRTEKRMDRPEKAMLASNPHIAGSELLISTIFDFQSYIITVFALEK